MAVLFVFVLAVGEWLLMLPRHASHTAGFAQFLRHIPMASSLPMLPNTVLTRNQLGNAEPRFELTAQWLAIWCDFDLQFWLYKYRYSQMDPTDPPQLSVRSVRMPM